LAAVLITAAVSIGGSWLIARQTADNREDSRLTAAWARITQLESRVTGLETLREADALTKRAMGDFIDVLEHHIWQQKPPPPPTRPPGV
ncbi:MAG: hypothetical protein KIT69_20735, partial [Propionibacteriaceae bacterium]|nr:hypothetical protein [Propionibacteriaceae bacterium]